MSLGKSLLVFGIGAAAGAAAGLLMAPTSGKKLRKTISKESKHYLDELESGWNDGVSTFKSSTKQAKEAIDKAADKLSKVVPN